MAQPIEWKPKPADPRHELQCKLEAAPIDHADAVLAAYALLQELQDHGVLDLLRGLVGAGSDVVTRLSEGADTPEAITAIRNLISTLKILGSIDPGILHDIAEMVTTPKETEPESFGPWKTLRRLGSKETLRGIGAVAYGLQVFGRVLIEQQFSIRR
jgi:uncharacterized protein YjgD (DUF1641 family)